MLDHVAPHWRANLYHGARVRRREAALTMRSVLLLISAAALLLAGCVTPAAETVEPAAAELAAPAIEPLVQLFEGHITASALGRLAHEDARTEMMFADLQREGFLLEIGEVPQLLQIDLEWTSTSPTASMFSMVNIPTTTHGEVLDVLSERSATGAVCMRVPLDEVATGMISVMAHSIDAANVDYVIRVTSVGGAVTLHADRGHMEVEREAGDEREALPCEEEAKA